MGKKAQGNGLIWIVAIVAVIWFLSSGGFTGFGGTTGTAPTEPTTATASLCPDTQKKVYVQVFDEDAATTTRVGGTMRIYDNTGKFIGSEALSTSAYSSGFSVCTEGNEYEAILFANATGNVASARGKFKVGFNDARIDLYTNTLDNLQARVKYVDTDAYAFLGAGESFATNGTAFTDVNTTHVGTDVVGTAKAIGADGKLELTVSLKAETARKYHGDKDYPEYLCVQQGTGNVWDVPTVARSGGNPLTNVKGNLNPNDLTYSTVSDSQYCYDAETVFPNTEQVFSVAQPTRASQNPGANDDIELHMLGSSLYQSVKSDSINAPVVGITTDASTQVLALHNTKYVPTLHVKIS